MGLVPSEGETEKCLSVSFALSLSLNPSLSPFPSLPPSLSLPLFLPLSLPLSVSLSLCSAPGEEAVLMPGRQWSAGSLLWNFQPPECGGCDCLLCKPPICLRSLLGAEPREDLCPPLPSPCVTAMLRSWPAASSPASRAPSCPASQAPCPAGESGQGPALPIMWGAERAHMRLPSADFGVYSCVSLGAPGIQMRG